VKDPRFDTVAHRLQNRAVLEPLIEAVTSTQPRAHWLAKCEAAGVPAGPIYSVPEALDDVHARARHMVQEMPHPKVGRVRGLGNPVKMSVTPARLDHVAPALGQDTDAILRELGLADAEITALRAQKVVA
jgi:crotonobetainyl-CoA:carnitine CoA-transferase CaiB-like acyl-CoA transferase